MASESSPDTVRELLPALDSVGEDFHSMLSHAIDAARGDDAQLRMFIYEVARAKLQRQGWTRQPPVSILEMRQYLRALEAAIRRIEDNASAAHQEPKIQFIESSGKTQTSAPVVFQDRNTEELQSGSGASEPIDENISKSNVIPFATPQEPIRPRYLKPLTSVSSAGLRSESRGLPTVSGQSGLWSATRSISFLLAGMTVLGLFYYLLAWRAELHDLRTELQTKLGVLGSTARDSQAPVAAGTREADSDLNAPTAASALPLPTVYGVYAISDGQLIELNPLAVTVPDQRIFMSAPIMRPSATILPDGKLVFIAFRRELVTSAPERVSVRTIARVMHALTIDPKGKANFTAVEAQWAIRSNAYEFRVAPLANPEMITIKSDKDDFSLPAGRYALVLKGQAYDFTIDGQIMDPTQCIERADTVNGPVYSQCPVPKR
jgi:hypothetical protein